jgi:RimJ/RimL family protein N-acetyltransferase
LSREPAELRLRLRPAADADCELLWHWANDPAARAASFHNRTIPWSEHVEWFEARQSDPRSRIYVIEESDRPVGVLRFDLEGRGATISLNIAPTSRGRGIGQEALRRGCALIAEQGAVESLTAYIKPDNTASLRAFEQTGFVQVGSTEVNGADALVLRRRSHDKTS